MLCGTETSCYSHAPPIVRRQHELTRKLPRERERANEHGDGNHTEHQSTISERIVHLREGTLARGNQSEKNAETTRQDTLAHNQSIGFHEEKRN